MIRGNSLEEKTKTKNYGHGVIRANSPTGEALWRECDQRKQGETLWKQCDQSQRENSVETFWSEETVLRKKLV